MSRPKNSVMALLKHQEYPIGGQKSQKQPKNWVKNKSQNWRKHKKQKVSAIWNDPKTVLEPYPNHQNKPLWAKKQKLSKNRLQLKVRIDGTL